jgi:cysteine protease ATG4
MIFSIVDEPPSWSDVDDSLESMSEPEEEEEEDMPEDKDTSSHSGLGDEEVHVEKGEVGGEDDGDEEDEEEDSDGDFFDAGEGAVVDDRVSSRAASKSGQSEGDTEDDPVGPMTPGPTTIVTDNTPVKGTTSRKAHAVSFARTPSASTDGGEGNLDDEEWVDPTPIPATPLDATPPALIPVPAPPMAKTKSSSSNSAKSRKKHRKEARAPALSPSVSVPFPSSSPRQNQGVTAAEGAQGAEEDTSRRIPQMSMARGRDGGRTQSGGVKGVIELDPGPDPEPEPGPEPELVELDPDADDF